MKIPCQANAPDSYLERIGSVYVVSVEQPTAKAVDSIYSCYCEKYDRWNHAVKYKTYIAAKQKGEQSGARWAEVEPIILEQWYGNLKPIAVMNIPSPSNPHVKGFECLCSCGNTVTRTAYSIRACRGHCGCLSVNANRVDPQLQRCHNGIIQRCCNSRNNSYSNYGGRGITVCKEWQDYFVFEEWALANGFEPGLTIDRINNEGSYEPGNCRWVTMNVQSRNRRSNDFVTLDNGKVLCRRDFAKMHQTPDLPYRTIESRIKEGWSPAAAIKNNVGEFTAFGESKKLAEWSKDSRCVVSLMVLRSRIQRGNSLEQALTKPIRQRQNGISSHSC